MKSGLLVFLIIFGIILNHFNLDARSDLSFVKPELLISQEVPFYFLKPIPPSIKLLDEIDLSFFRNQSVVTQYRYRLEIPDEGATVIDRNLTRWSPWISINFIAIIIPILDQEGGYKLVVEYRTSKINEVLKFEKVFYVYRGNQIINVENAKSNTLPVNENAAAAAAVKTAPVSDKSVKKTLPVINKAAAKTATGTKLNSRNSAYLINKIIIKTNSINFLALNISQVNNSRQGKQSTLTDSEDEIVLKTAASTGKSTAEPSKAPVNSEIFNATDYNKQITDAIERKDAALFIKLLQSGSGIGISGTDGGNIFHLLNDEVSSDELISILKNKGISINETDNNGNTPLHVAILSGESMYARSLINLGADLIVKNKLELSPLHLAVFINNKDMSNLLLLKGAEIDLKGNSGYTPLHIASELNNFSMAKDLLSRGANPKIKTDQKLTSIDIAKIQNNSEIFELISKKGSNLIDLTKSDSTINTSLLNYSKLNPKYDFSLPYDIDLVNQRQFNKVIRIISIPVFALSAAGTVFLRKEANYYYSSYQNAETIDLAKHYYHKTVKFDTFTYISGGVSLTSLFIIVHSAIRQRTISNRMSKTFY